ncbi:helix-turn-helix transcriptional regulator [Shimia thalassica]|uniref:helix-turn-helix transcriptional regulator n=1 Tax=Shimia thalassica TaxID=1715693 RepID=UPI0026E38C66|nr:AlpA family phage regulatory protein [Shimia thalassica]MDO6485971.1 AlpA family phage regulatory protein [Shimia thalassica]
MPGPKRDPKNAQRDLFEDECQTPSSKPGKKVKKRVSARKPRPKHTELATRFLTVNQVAKRYGICKATVWRWVNEDPYFPAPVKLSAGTSRWKEEHLSAFEDHAEKRGNANDLRKKVIK